MILTSISGGKATRKTEAELQTVRFALPRDTFGLDKFRQSFRVSPLTVVQGAGPLDGPVGAPLVRATNGKVHPLLASARPFAAGGGGQIAHLT